jgi:hypothetical protein
VAYKHQNKNEKIIFKMRERWGEKKKNINFLVFCLALKTRTAIQETNNFSGYRLGGQEIEKDQKRKGECKM